MYGFVYIWYDRKHKRYYIGCHWGAEDDGYICSSTWMKSAYKRRPNDFKRRIISKIYTSKSDMYIIEEQWLKLIPKDELGVKYYNLKTKKSGTGWNGKKHSEETKKKLSIIQTGKKHSDETKQKLSKIRKGKILSNEHKLKLSAARKGWQPSTEIRQKISSTLTGRKLSDETKQKMSLAAKNRLLY